MQVEVRNKKQDLKIEFCGLMLNNFIELLELITTVTVLHSEIVILCLIKVMLSPIVGVPAVSQ